MARAKWILCFSLLTALSCKESIIHDLNEGELHKVTALLNGEGIQSHWARQGEGRWTIEVESNDSARAIEILQVSRILREKRDVEQEKSMLPSEQEDRLRYERSVSNSLEETLLTLDGVEEARVHLQLNSPEIFPVSLKNERQYDSASILLVVSIPDALTPEDVMKLVSGGTGISPDKITVVIKFLEKKNPAFRQLPVAKTPDGNLFSKLALLSTILITVGGILLWRSKIRKTL